MTSPFILIRVKSERANQLAWFCSVVAAITLLIWVCLMALNEAQLGRYRDVIAILVTGLFLAPVVFIVVGYLVLGIAWVVEGFRNKDSK